MNTHWTVIYKMIGICYFRNLKNYDHNMPLVAFPLFYMTLLTNHNILVYTFENKVCIDSEIANY